MSFEHELNQALRARITLLVAVTREEIRLMEQIKRACQNTGRPLFVWDVGDGFTSPVGAAAPSGVRDALSALDAVEKLPDESLTVLPDFHDLWSNAQIKRKLRNLAQRLHFSRRSLLVTTPLRKIPEELKDECVVLDFGLPSPSELEAVVAQICSLPGLKVNLTPLGRSKLVSAAAGLSAAQVQRELSRAVVEHGLLDDRHIVRMSDAKKQILRDQEALEYYPISETCEDVGGLDVLKDWLRLRERAFSPEAREYGLPAPRGIALLGIPGTGKSLTARIVGGLWRMPLVRLDVGALFGSLVGESEERARRALRVAEAIAPCILWIDELEKALAAGGGDNGTSARVFGTILTWMQEKTAPCFVVATANDVRALPAELMRRGRFDEIFFLDLPTREERRDIFAVHLRKRQRLPQDYDLEALARASEGFVGAEVEQAILDAMVVGFNAGREFTTADVLEALRRQVPISASHREIVQQLRDWLKQGRAQSASFREVQEAARKFVPLTGFDDLVKEN
ncbi:MAG: AAA family ATPase [Candidatus Xenobia bacterium]